MIIISQDKTKIINFDNIAHIFISKDSEKHFLIEYGKMNGVSELLGVYETIERAKEVLEEISLAFANMEMLKIPKIDIHQLIPATEMVRNLCYKMPKE